MTQLNTESRLRAARQAAEKKDQTWSQSRIAKFRAGQIDKTCRKSDGVDGERSLRLQSSGRWGIFRPGRDSVEIISGEPLRDDVDGELRVTRKEHLYGEGYYSILARRDAGGDRGAGRVTVWL